MGAQRGAGWTPAGRSPPTWSAPIVAEELAAIAAELGENAYAASQVRARPEVFEQVALADEFADFLTLPAYAATHDAELTSTRGA